MDGDEVLSLMERDEGNISASCKLDQREYTAENRKSQHPAQVIVISIAQLQLPPMDGGATSK